MTDKTIDLIVDTGGAIRMAFLMSHYRSPCEIGPKKLDEARKVLRRFALACEPNLDGPPLEILQALDADMNTPQAIAIMHGYRKRKEGKKLFAALRFLGFFGSTCVPDEVKTLPEGHIWNAPQHLGFETLQQEQ